MIDMTKVTYIDLTFLHQIDALRLRLKQYRVTLLGVNKWVRKSCILRTLTTSSRLSKRRG